MIDSHRSRQSGLPVSIRLIFQSRRHFLISFSREIAAITSSWVSNQTRRLMPYFAVNPANALLVLVHPPDEIVCYAEIRRAVLAAG